MMSYIECIKFKYVKEAERPEQGSLKRGEIEGVIV